LFLHRPYPGPMNTTDTRCWYWIIRQLTKIVWYLGLLVGIYLLFFYNDGALFQHIVVDEVAPWISARLQP